MNFELFDSMSLQEANEHLKYFLETESAALEAMRPAMEEAGLVMDYSIASLPPILKWIVNMVSVVRVPVPDTEPDWIRQAHEHGLIDFPAESKLRILRAAYYLGESFIRSSSSLRWTTGNPDYIEKNMPVVSGFKSGTEMAPMMIVENLCRRIVGRGGPPTEIDRAVSAWAADMPGSEAI